LVLLIAWLAKFKCYLMIKIKGSVVTVHVMKAHGGNGVIVKPISVPGRGLVCITLRSLYPQGKRPKLRIDKEAGLDVGPGLTV
jgi:hypothetical protein